MKSDVADLAGGPLASRGTETTAGNMRLRARVGDVPASGRRECRKGKQPEMMATA